MDSFPHQVGGHFGGISKMLTWEGYLLKPFQDKGRGEQEYAFYKHIATPNSHKQSRDVQSLLSFLPAFHGVLCRLKDSHELRKQGDISADKKNKDNIDKEAETLRSKKDRSHLIWRCSDATVSLPTVDQLEQHSSSSTTKAP